MHICKSAHDEHVPEGRWLASLSNGETVYEDCCPHETKCWLRLGEYCKENNLIITQMRWQFRHMMHVSEKNAEGYCLIRKMRSFGPTSMQSFCGIGYIKGDKAHITFLSDTGHSFKNVRDVSEITEPGQIIYNV